MDLVADALACPICGEPLTRDGRALSCPSRHTFDVAKQGYASLVVGGRTPKTGDTADMVASRDAFLRSGAYDPIADAVSAALPASRVGDGDAAVSQAGAAGGPQAGAADAPDAPSDAAVHLPGLIVDIAGGTGYYLARVLDAHPSLIGLTLDLSPLAARRAARSHRRAAAGTADAWGRLPLRDAAASHLLSIFGPRNGPEMLRVLRPGGSLVVVTPQPGHLAELRAALGMIGIAERKDERLDTQLAGFDLVDRSGLEYTLVLGRDDIRDEVLMGPSAHHLDPSELDERIASLADRTEVTVAVTVSTFRRP
ncbi:putative RNA methyltransferase [Plantibacter sp. Mn2098]|uniref:putative RNA methyltransferase n=1 Tax=Plantibacter sp. Mn2098 TaxID=3395266 RepID=UPI003BC7A921